ncbi:MAG TPA: ABC transporter permease [Thermoplasmata archaeon]|nr:ABC transporter permease [Thermoplasmata archaeon]
MTEAVVPDVRQLTVAIRYQLQSYLRTSRFLAMVVFVIIVGGALWGVLAYLVHAGTISNPGDSSALLAGFLFFLAIIVYFCAALLGGDAISTDFGSRTGYYTLVLPIRRRILLFGRYIAAVAATSVIAVLYYVFAIGADLYFTGSVPVLPLLESILIALFFSAAAVALAFFFSSLVKTPAFSILLTVLVLFVFLPIISSVITSYANIEPWFELTYSSAAISEPIVPVAHRLDGAFAPYIWEGLVIMAAYLVVFLGLSWAIYEYKEVSG